MTTSSIVSTVRRAVLNGVLSGMGGIRISSNEGRTYYGGGMTTGSTVLRVAPLDGQNNIVAYLRNGSMALTLEGAVAIPAGAQIPSSWTASVQGCFFARVKETLQEMIDGTR